MCPAHLPPRSLARPTARALALLHVCSERLANESGAPRRPASRRRRPPSRPGVAQVINRRVHIDVVRVAAVGFINITLNIIIAVMKLVTQLTKALEMCDPVYAPAPKGYKEISEAEATINTQALPLAFGWQKCVPEPFMQKV